MGTHFVTTKENSEFIVRKKISFARLPVMTLNKIPGLILTFNHLISLPLCSFFK